MDCQKFCNYASYDSYGYHPQQFTAIKRPSFSTSSAYFSNSNKVTMTVGPFGSVSPQAFCMYKKLGEIEKC